MSIEVKVWNNEYTCINGFIDLGSCSGLANKVHHELYAFPSISEPGHFEVGARFGPNGDYVSCSTMIMGSPSALVEKIRRNKERWGDVYLEIYEAHQRLYKTTEWLSTAKLRTKHF